MFTFASSDSRSDGTASGKAATRLALASAVATAACAAAGAAVLAGSGLLAPAAAAMVSTAAACGLLAMLRLWLRLRPLQQRPCPARPLDPAGEAEGRPTIPAAPAAAPAGPDALARGIRNRDALIAVASHDLRSALNAMVGWLYLARSPKADADALARALDGIAGAVDTQRRLVDALLDTARVLDGRAPAHPSPISTEGLLERVAAHGSEAARQRNVALEVLPAIAPRWFEADPVHVEDALRALLRHAVAIAPEQGVVRLQAMHADADDGCTIELRVSCVVAAPERSGARTLAPLPIAIARAVTEMQGGRLEVEHQGRSLRLRFPEARGPAARAAQAAAAATERARAPGLPDGMPDAGVPGDPDADDRRLAGCHVLLTDDREDMLEVTAEVLRRHGARVATSRSGAETLDRYPGWATGGGERLLLSDLSMPGMDGVEMIRRLRSLEAERGLPRLPAVAFSAQADAWSRRAVLLAGFDAFLAKPIAPAKMVDALLPLVGR